VTNRNPEKNVYSPKPLTPVDEAIAEILSYAKPVVETESVPLIKALGRVLAVDQVASIDVPPLDNSAMDGYAFGYSDVPLDKKLVVSQRIVAGEVGAPLKPGTAARIFTGAPIPAGADSIVMQENVEVVGNAILIKSDIKQGRHVRPRGQDIKKGSCILAKGKRLKPQEIGLLASIGVQNVEVFRPLKVAVMSTGDELVEPGQPLAEGQIYNSNRYTLSALLHGLGCEVIDGGIVGDSFEATCQQLTVLAVKADVIISSGGVSVGEEDHVKAAVESLGSLFLWKLSIKPGKPLAFGTVESTPFFGLPGNPSSVLVTFSLCARPFLLRSQGLLQVEPVMTQVIADFEIPNAGSRQEYLRVNIANGKAKLHPNQSSGVLASASWANALAVIPIGATVKVGDFVDVLLISELLS
jgi:molybdopterin molybdotransferase